MGFPRWPWRASCIVVCPSLRRPSAPPPDSAHPVSRGQFPAISSLPAGLSQAVATPFFSWGLRVVPLPIFGSPAVSPSTELPSARLPPAHFSLRADTLRGSMQRHCGCAKFLNIIRKSLTDRGCGAILNLDAAMQHYEGVYHG